MRRRSWPFALVALCRCWHPPEAGSRGYTPSLHASAPPPADAIVAARVSNIDQPNWIAVVFDRELDAASLVPSTFMIALADGSRVLAQEATLAPASEDDENRTVMLSGKFGDAPPPTDVMLIGSVYGEDGANLAGSIANVGPRAKAVGVVELEVLPPLASRCPSAGQVARLYWDDVVGLTDADHAHEGISIGFVDGTSMPAMGLDDVSELGLDVVQDNVVDVCVPSAQPVSRVDIAAGVFKDARSQPIAGVTVTRRALASADRSTP